MHAPLAPYAACDNNSRGRQYPEPPPTYRNEHQRDRDRVIHSAAFRRLEYKTQVFVNHEGDMFRTRLTHSIEVAQIARTIARALQLNEDLAEAIAVAHDLGHTPFGHAGQRALNDCMRPYGGFEHNLQSLRVVDVLEEKYAEFDGLNLTFETREGILKRCPRGKAEILGELGRRFLSGGQPTLEAQLTNLADEIAYNNHDIDDGLRAGLLTREQLLQVPIFRQHCESVVARHPSVSQRRLAYETVRSMIGAQVTDLVETSRERLLAAAPASIERVRENASPLIAFSDAMRSGLKELKEFLMTNLYRHYRVMRMSTKADRVVRELFAAFMGDPRLLPAGTQSTAIGSGEEAARAQVIADYIAGMTDRYAIAEYGRIFTPGVLT
ncbi:MAG: deoxyguanosinetriphosphate triphosphohydrolase [Gammaproteobacteria bacterium]|nr:deoxyguanosinetriphosphate triphosphohydrolase [Gammaproteobacteria bacterium]